MSTKQISKAFNIVYQTCLAALAFLSSHRRRRLPRSLHTRTQHNTRCLLCCSIALLAARQSACLLVCTWLTIALPGLGNGAAVTMRRKVF